MRMVLVEKIKTLIIYILVLNSLFLTSKIWFSEKLWPSGYNFFVSLTNNNLFAGFTRYKRQYSYPKENLSIPKVITLCSDSNNKSVFYNSDTGFFEVFSEIKPIIEGYLNGSFQKAQQSNVTLDDYYYAISGEIPAIYVDYQIAYSAPLFGQVNGVNLPQLPDGIDVIKNFIIIPHDIGFSILVKDPKSNAVVRTTFYDTGIDVGKIIDKYNTTTEENFFFASELNLNKTLPETNITFDPMVIVFSDYEEVPPAIISNIPDLREDNVDLLNKILRHFSYNPKSVRRYIDTSGVITYVENNSSLKIYPIGLIEYSSISNNKGIELNDAQSQYSALNESIDFAQNLWNILNLGESLNIALSNDLVYTSTKNEYTFNLDYYYGGNIVLVDIPYEQNKRLNHALSITVQNGKITKFSFLARTFEDSAKKVELMDTIGAIDSFYEQKKDSSMEKVEEIFISYLLDERAQIIDPCWTIKSKSNGMTKIHVIANGGSHELEQD